MVGGPLWSLRPEESVLVHVSQPVLELTHCPHWTCASRSPDQGMGSARQTRQEDIRSTSRGGWGAEWDWGRGSPARRGFPDPPRKAAIASGHLAQTEVAGEPVHLLACDLERVNCLHQVLTLSSVQLPEGGQGDSG